MRPAACGGIAVVAMLLALGLTARTGDAQACARPNVAARVTNAVTPDVPAMAQQQGISGSVQIVVSLDADGRVTAARIQSSPSAVLNAAALAAARQSTYQTAIRDCVPVAVDYLFNVFFAGGGSTTVTAAGGSEAPTLVVSAQGAASRLADSARLGVALFANDDDSAAAAAEKIAALYDGLRAKLRPLGVPETSISSTSYSVFYIPRPGASPDPRTTMPFAAYQPPPGRYGHVVTSLLQIVVPSVAKTGAIVDAVLAGGATRVDTLQFNLRDVRDACAEALAAAIGDAAAQARAVAAASGVQITGLKQIQGGGCTVAPESQGPRSARRFPTARPTASDLRPVPVDVRGSVNVTYTLKP